MKTMRKYVIIIASFMFLTSCVQDLGSYADRSAADLIPRITSTLEEAYIAIILEYFSITPEIDGDPANYEFLWHVFPHPLTTQNQRDTIGREKNLNYRVTLAEGMYRLIFEVRCRETGVTAFQYSILNVTSEFGEGFFILTYENGRTDMDFITRNGVVSSNIFATINGQGLLGRPIRASLTSQFVPPGGTWATMIAVSSDEDLQIFYGSDMRLFRGWDDLFMLTPEVRRPQGVWGTGTGFVLLNNGLLHHLRGAMGSPALFGHNLPDEGFNLTSGRAAVVGSTLAFFNENTGSIVGYAPGTHRFAYTEVTQAVLAQLPGNDQHHFTNQELLWLGNQHNFAASTPRGWALLKSNNPNEVGRVRLLDMMMGSWAGFSSLIYNGHTVVPDGFLVGEGTVFAAQNGHLLPGNRGDLIYFSTGDNRVHIYNHVNQTQALNVITLPTDETVVDMQHYFSLVNLLPTAILPENALFVLSNRPSGWVLRIFGMLGATANVDESNLIATFEGTGEATQVMIREVFTTRTW